MRIQHFTVGSVERKLLRCASIEDPRRVAKRRLPGAVFDYIDGGAEVFQVYVWKDRGVVTEMIE